MLWSFLHAALFTQILSMSLKHTNPQSAKAGHLVSPTWQICKTSFQSWRGCNSRAHFCNNNPTHRDFWATVVFMTVVIHGWWHPLRIQPANNSFKKNKPSYWNGCYHLWVFIGYRNIKTLLKWKRKSKEDWLNILPY